MRCIATALLNLVFRRIHFLTFLFAVTNTLQAQLSPGELQRSHAFLEGLTNCTRCHSAGAKISLSKCLDCHTILKEEIRMKQGLHARPNFRNCISCHRDHLGRNFEMIHWKEGQENFHHSLTGYELQGAHRKVKCRSCHQPRNIIEKEKLLAKDKDLQRTFLGLGRACLDCHLDEHRGQLSEDCLTCHRMSGWRPAPGFDHHQTRFPLTGRHRTVACIHCHPVVKDDPIPGDDRFTKFTGLRFARCQDCHADVHRGQLGSRCQSCHSTAGWHMVNSNRFNHERTRFPLKGRHRSVECEKCHRPGRPFRGLRFAACMDCHEDFHRGQFATRPSAGGCEDCHTEEGHRPSTFTITRHQDTEFPLTGAHLAIPCFVCHRGNPGDAKPGHSMLKINRFTFPGFKCRDCHADIHQGQFALPMASTGRTARVTECSRCHVTDHWQADHFDHNRDAVFALEGAHQRVACRECHPTVQRAGTEMVLYKPLKTRCRDCHGDTFKEVIR